MILAACNYDAMPVVSSAGDVRSLPKDTGAIDARRLSDDDIGELERIKGSLRTIRFGRGSGSYEANITDQGLKKLAAIEWSDLQDLGLDQCDAITDEGLGYLVAMKTLRILSLEGCDRITDRGLDALSSMTWLEYVGLSNVKNISRARIELLRKQLPDTSVSLDGYSKRPKPFREHGNASQNTNSK
jgi:hypothetical protein